VPPPINVEKTGDKECRVGAPCTFEITITNSGTSGFSGPIRIGDAIGVGSDRLEGVEIAEIVPPLGCSPEPTTLPMSCVATMTLGAGESRVHQVTVVIPDDSRFANIREPVSARNCVGVVSPDTPVASIERGMSAAPETTGRPGTQPFACHSFTIADQVQECSPGFVMNAAGRCACPEGTTFRNGQCSTVGGGTVTPTPPTQCTLLPGQIRTEDGRCICPRGTELVNRRCVKDEPPVVRCKLLPGQIRLDNGRCVCPRGTSLVRGECRKYQVQCRLLPGQIRTQNGRCVCPRGTSLVRGECRKDQVQCKLLPGQIRLENGRCVCPRGTSLVRGECRKDQVQCKLLPGQIRLENGRCVCPRGTSLIRGECRKTQADRCPRGTVGTPPNCRKLQIQQISPDLQRLIEPTQKQPQ
jgi:nitrite reductase/ring-hydroxylating ferredoxin subunit